MTSIRVSSRGPSFSRHWTLPGSKSRLRSSCRNAPISVQAGQPDRLLGYEIYTSPYVPTVEASALTIAFGDFNNYWIADRSGRTDQRLNELYAGNGQVGFIATERVDGKVILSEGIKLLKMGA